MNYKCDICFSSKYERFGTYQEWHDTAQRLKDEPLEVIQRAVDIPSAKFDFFSRCLNCDFIQAVPLPTDEALTSYYQNYAGEDNYLDRLYKWVERSCDTIEYLKKFVYEGAFLDVACSMGGLTYAASKSGFQATGIEIDERALEVAREKFPNCEFIKSTIEEFVATGRYFDIICASEIIEHVTDIHSFLDSLSNLMKRGAFLYLSTPEVTEKMLANYNAFIEWSLVGPPEHLSYFTKHNLTNLLEVHGFQIVEFHLPKQPQIRVLVRRN